MRITVKLYGPLRRFLAAGANQTVLDLPEGAAVADAVAALGIPPEHAQMIISDEDQLRPTAVLHDGQELDVFPPLAGGCRLH
jgi:molybdopterin converting factor small subunit